MEHLANKILDGIEATLIDQITLCDPSKRRPKCPLGLSEEDSELLIKTLRASAAQFKAGRYSSIEDAKKRLFS